MTIRGVCRVASAALPLREREATSACYHGGRWSVAAKARMRRLDHSMILIGIAATYTPIAAIGPGSLDGPPSAGGGMGPGRWGHRDPQRVVGRSPVGGPGRVHRGRLVPSR
jgi:hypothetical protein